jgi:NAD-dependent deacetylase
MGTTKLDEILAQKRDGNVVIMTGAGISAESGIPTFRGKEGYWTVGSQHYHPQEMATYANFNRMPEEVWTWYLYRRGVCHRAAPNVAHQAVVECEKGLGDRFTLITQNVDGLHLRAGNSRERTFEIHGNIDFMRCANECSTTLYAMPDGVASKDQGNRLTPEELALLRCPRCDGPSRPHVLWFDESYNEHHFRFESSLQAAQTCDLLVVVGTAGATNLPNHVVHLAIEAGASVIDINPESNPFSAAAEAAGGFWLQGGAGAELPKLVAKLLG